MNDKITTAPSFAESPFLSENKVGEFFNLLYTPESHALTTVTGRELKEYSTLNEKEGRIEMVLTDKIGLFITSLDDVDKDIKSETWKVLDIFCIEFNKKNTYKEKRPDKYQFELTISKERLAKLLGYKQQNEANRRISFHIGLINKLGFKVGQYVNTKKGRFLKHRIIKVTGEIDVESEQDTKSKDVTLIFGWQFASRCNTEGFIGQIPSKLLACSNQNGSLYTLGRYLALLFSIDDNVIAGRENFVSIPNCLAQCPTIPKKETIKNRTERQKIMYKLRDTLDELVNSCGFKYWKLVDKNRRELGKGELDYCSYEQFLEYYILYEVEGRGSHEERLIEVKQKLEQKRKTRRKTTKKALPKESKQTSFDFDEAK